jgi:outer membrane lipoprotein SlyB
MVSKGHGCCRYIIKENKMNRLEKAAEFGAMMGKRAALDPAVSNALGLGAVGLAGGGLLGGLSGYANPGDLLDSKSKPQVEFDETGKIPLYNSDGTFKTKKKSKLRAAIEGAMGGGLLGGLGGAAVGGGGTELMRVSPKIQNWFAGNQIKGDTKIPIDAVNDLKNDLISGSVNYANRKYDQLGRDKHFDFMRNGMPEDTASQLEIFGKKIGPEFYNSPDWKLNPNPGQPTPVDKLFKDFGPTAVNNPLSRGANSAVDWLSGLFNKK